MSQLDKFCPLEKEKQKDKPINTLILEYVVSKESNFFGCDPNWYNVVIETLTQQKQTFECQWGGDLLENMQASISFIKGTYASNCKRKRQEQEWWLLNILIT